ncbi:hypothetical protein TNIN_242331 [Trichonephila inaurata madagascariensis]|uniref:Uncharacterized protein n=1 Tax=Trichonephila inaurata madagascariensis TaxID=2747483 RepID=A0A8X6YUT2_9ARAC|nr:hypothetical protein TNIN_242331 [Trichonephila inaurata madagascariensis]
MQNLTPMLPTRFLFEISTADTKDLDVWDANHFKKRLRFRAKVFHDCKIDYKDRFLKCSVIFLKTFGERSSQ